MFKISRNLLATELPLLLAVAEKKTTIPVLAFVHVKVLNGSAVFTATDLDVSLTVQLEAQGEDWSGCVPLQELNALVKLLSPGEIQFTEKPKSRIEIKQGKSTHLLPTAKTSDFPSIHSSEGATFVISAALFREALDKVVFCAGEEERRFGLQGVNLSTAEGKLRVVATNGQHCGVVTVDTDADIGSAITVPTRACLALLAMLEGGDASITTGKVLAVQSGSRKLVSRLIDMQFPKWEMFMPSSLKYQTEADPAELIAAIKRAAVTSRSLELVRLNLKFTFTKNEIIVESRGGEGEGREPVPVSSSLNGDAIEIGMNGEHWLRFLAGAKSPIRCQFNDPKGQILLTRKDDLSYRYVTMPARL